MPVNSSNSRIKPLSALTQSTGEIKKEFFRIYWGNTSQLKSTVQTILVSMLVFGLLTYAADLTIQFALQTLRALVLRAFV